MRAGESVGRRRRRPVLWALLLCLLLACDSPEEREQTHLERARAARAEGQLPAAVLEYRSVLQSAPNHPEAHYELALALLDLDRADKAMWELMESVRLDPANRDARLRLAWLSVAAQRPDEALEQASAILEGDPGNVEARLVRGAGLLQQAKFEEAAAESEAILADAPDEKRAYYNLARARAAQGRLEDAERHLLRYRELDGRSHTAASEVLRFYLATHQPRRAERFLREVIPEAAAEDRPELALALASLMAEQDRLGESEPFLQLALAGAPERIDVRERLATLMADAGRVDEALELLGDEDVPGSPSAEVHRVRGDMLASAGRFEEALAAYRAGLRLDGSLAPLRVREAEVLLRLGDVQTSSERIRALLAQYPEDPMVGLAHVQTLAMASRTDQAIEALRGLLAREPLLAPAHFLLGVLQLASNRPAEASRSLEIAAARLQGAAAGPARTLLAEAQLRAGRYEAAVANAKRALGDDPENLRARIILAHALLESGSPGVAEVVLHESHTESSALHAALARVYVKTGRLEQAQASVERALALDPDSVQWVVDLVWVQLEQGKSDAALELARSRMLEHPDEPEYPNLVGRALLERDDLAAAGRAFRRAVEVDPDFVPGYVNLARLAARQGQYDQARELLQRALARRPGDAEALRELGIVEYRRGDPAAAVEAFRQALRADPGSESTRANLAQAQAEAGQDLASALEIARAIRQSDPEDPVSAEALGLVLYRSGLHQAAAEQFRAAIELAPHPIAVYHYRLGLALLGSGEPKAAVAELDRALALDSGFPGAEDARTRLAELAL